MGWWLKIGNISLREDKLLLFFLLFDNYNVTVDTGGILDLMQHFM